MRSKGKWITIIGVLSTATLLWSQAPQPVAVRAGHLFDPKSGQMLANQVVLIQGQRITDVGPAASVSIPAAAKVIDLSRATVLPGLIDGHVHLTDEAGGLQHQMLVAYHSAMESLKAGFTTQVAQGSHGGGFADVDSKKRSTAAWSRDRASDRLARCSPSQRPVTVLIPWSGNRSSPKSSPMAWRGCAPESVSSPTTVPIT